jgi:hypothetical protein
MVLMTVGTNESHVISRLKAALERLHLQSAPALLAAMAATARRRAGSETAVEEDAYDVREAEFTDAADYTPPTPRPESEEPAMPAARPEDDPIVRAEAISAERAALKLAIDATLQEIEPAGADGELRSIRDLLYTLRDGAPVGTDPTPRWFLECRHAYAVLDVHLVFAGDDPVPGTADAAEDLLPRLDAVQSTVTLYNPQGGNSPNIDGDVTGDTGRFTLSLDRLLNAAHRITSTELSRD